jgi:hypothetical protein
MRNLSANRTKGNVPSVARSVTELQHKIKRIVVGDDRVEEVTQI